MIEIITIEREYGSGAGEIAKKLAARLGWELFDKAITEEIARRLKCDVKSVEQREEKPDSGFYRLIKIFMRGSYEERYSGGGSTDLLDAEQLAQLFEAVINDIADRKPCVIVGRAAPWFLRERPNHMGVFIFAPREEKLRRLKEAGVDMNEAERLIEEVDRDRVTFIKRYCGKSWPQRELYHLMINSISGDDAVIDLILHQLEFANALMPR